MLYGTACQPFNFDTESSSTTEYQSYFNTKKKIKTSAYAYNENIVKYTLGMFVNVCQTAVSVFSHFIHIENDWSLLYVITCDMR